MASERKSSADEAGVGPDPRQVRHLMPLRELKRYRLLKGEPDIRGWSVYTSNGREVGRIAELLADPTVGEVVMLEVDLTGSNRRVMAPIRAAWIDRASKRVILDGAQLSIEDELPTLGRSAPAPEEPRRLTDQVPVHDEGAAVAPATAANPIPPAAPRAAPAPGTEVVVERHVVPGDEAPAMSGADTSIASAGDRKLIEEVVVRRRYVDAAELAALEKGSPPEPRA
jgi:sporulation protein YlmC with PRC-barrel domain